MAAEWVTVDPSQQLNYNLLEGRFKQLQGKRSEGQRSQGADDDMFCVRDLQVTDETVMVSSPRVFLLKQSQK